MSIQIQAIATVSSPSYISGTSVGKTSLVTTSKCPGLPYQLRPPHFGLTYTTKSTADYPAWVKKGTKESVGIIQDFVDPDLTDFIYQIVEKYRESTSGF